MSAELATRATAANALTGQWPLLQRLGSIGSRYGLSASGPVSISVAHFIAAFILLRALSLSEFGLFSFALIIVPLFLSMSGALLGVSVSAAIIRSQAMVQAELATHLKANLAYSAFACAVVGLLMLATGASTILAALFGLYCGLMVLRCFGRAYLYAMNQQQRVVFSDFVYSGVLIVGLFGLVLAGKLTVINGAALFTASVALALIPLGANYLRDQFWPAASGSLLAYKTIWRELSRWSLLGVVLTEITVNAHAYLVTFIFGSKAFALLAVGALFMRPVALCLSALPDMERPLMARSIASGNVGQARRSVIEFRLATAAVWIVTILLSSVLLIWFPHLVLKSGYSQSEVFIVVGIWALIMAVRTLRMPESVLLQAACQYRPLAGTAVWSSITSLIVTMLLLIVAGPIASLGGILVGDAVMALGIFALSRAWKPRHG